MHWLSFQELLHLLLEQLGRLGVEGRVNIDAVLAVSLDSATLDKNADVLQDQSGRVGRIRQVAFLHHEFRLVRLLMHLSQLHRSVLVFVKVVGRYLQVVDDEIADAEADHAVLLYYIFSNQNLQVVRRELLVLRANEYAVLVRHLYLVVYYLQLSRLFDPIRRSQPLAENAIVSCPRDRIVSKHCGARIDQIDGIVPAFGEVALFDEYFGIQAGANLIVKVVENGGADPQVRLVVFEVDHLARVELVVKHVVPVHPEADLFDAEVTRL